VSFLIPNASDPVIFVPALFKTLSIFEQSPFLNLVLFVQPGFSMCARSCA
jgi:hypothetical protein